MPNLEQLNNGVFWLLSFINICLFVLFNTTFNNISVISWRSVLSVEETGGPGENHLFCFFLYKENYIKSKVLLHHGYVPVSDIGYDE
jgi:hypothetical protein